MRHKRAAISIHLVSGCRKVFLCDFIDVFIDFKYARLSLLRLQPSTISTIWTPHSDTEAPSDRHLLHHQQGRGLRRVSHRTTRWPRLLRFYSLYLLIECITLVLLPVDFEPCEGTPNYPPPPPPRRFHQPLKGRWLWASADTYKIAPLMS